MLSIQKHFPLNKTFLFGTTAFIIGFSGIMAFLVQSNTNLANFMTPITSSGQTAQGNTDGDKTAGSEANPATNDSNETAVTPLPTLSTTQASSSSMGAPSSTPRATTSGSTTNKTTGSTPTSPPTITPQTGTDTTVTVGGSAETPVGGGSSTITVPPVVETPDPETENPGTTDEDGILQQTVNGMTGTVQDLSNTLL